MSTEKDSFAQVAINDEADLKRLFKFVAKNLCGGKVKEVEDVAGFEGKKVELKDVIDLCSSYGVQLKLRVEYNESEIDSRPVAKKEEPVVAEPPTTEKEKNTDDPF